MAKVVQVTEADVARAQLLVQVNESLNRPTSDGIRKIAAAKPLPRRRPFVTEAPAGA